MCGDAEHTAQRACDEPSARRDRLDGLALRDHVGRWSGTHWGDVWFDFRNNIMEPYFTVIDTAGNVNPPVRVSDGNAEIDLETLDIVYGNRFAIVWADPRAAGLQLYLAFIECS
jgi:hypothetical protein